MTDAPLVGKAINSLRPGVKNILVTGGAGFIGSWVVRHLVVHYPDYNIICFDKLDYCSTLRNLESVEARPNFRLVRGDIERADDVRAALQTHAIDTVMHFAAQSHVDLSFGNSLSFSRTNVLGTHVLLESCTAHGVKLFIHVSTDEVYGEVPRGQPDLLETAILKPTNPYSASKAAAEMLVNAYYKSFKLPVIVVRSNNVYGPGQFPEKIIPKFTCLIQRGQKPMLHGDGSPTRHYLYGADAADAFDYVLSKGEIGQIYNVASEDEVSNMDICRLLFAENGQSVLNPAQLRQQVDFVQDRPFNDDRYAVDGAKLRKLGWKPNTPFAEGLATTFEWYRQHKDTWWGDITPVLTAYPISTTSADGHAELLSSPDLS